MSLAVIGTGFGRTGTLSLKGALEKLGFGRCYHMMEVLSNPRHAPVWSAAAKGEPVDWDALFEGYGSTVDWPSTRFWRELLARFPDARVVHTERDPELWYESVRNTIYQAMSSSAEIDHEGLRSQRDLARKIVLEQTFGARFEDREHALEVFRRHNRAVRDEVDPERLLIFEVAEGWAPLCRFLDRPEPDEPFPRVNTTEEFRERFRAAAS